MAAPPPPPPPPDASGHSKLFSPVTSIPSTLIRPTTAGLMHYETAHDHLEANSSNQSRLSPTSAATGNRTLSSPQFKEELRQKQSRFVSSPIPVEERIKIRKQEEMVAIPEKLMSSVQRDRKPFAYTPDVCNPSDRGKLDLRQIKSPIMKRRLLANMNSLENNDQENCEQEETNLDEVENPIKPKEFEEIRVYHEKPQKICQPSRPLIQHHQTTKFENTFYAEQLPTSGPIQTNRPTNVSMQYYEPARFYNTNQTLPDEAPIMEAPRKTVEMANNFSGYLSPSELRNQRMAALTDEVNESLTKLVSDLQFGGINNTQDRYTCANQQNSHQRPSSFGNYQRPICDRNPSNSADFRSTQMVYSHTYDSFPRDYLQTSPDSSYFSTSTSPHPYESPANSSNCENSHQSQFAQRSMMFSPTNYNGNLPRGYHAPAQNYSTQNPIRELQITAEKIENGMDRISRLQNLYH